MTEPQPKINRSLWSMLTTLQEAEDELIFITEEEIKELLGDVRGKVDAIEFTIAKLNGEEKRLAALIKKHQSRKSSVKNTIANIKAYCARTLDSMQTDQLFGDEWDVKITSSVATQSLIKEPSEEHAITFHQFIRTKYAWDKDLVKAELLRREEKEEKPEDGLDDLVILKRNQSVQFTSHKGK